MWSTASLIAAVPARHFSGRGLFDRNKTLWCSWVVINGEQRVYHSGDTGMTSQFRDIGMKYGPFDIAFVKIAAYHENWPDIHLKPEQAIEAFGDLRGSILVPIHWGTFNLSMHSWYDPIERLVEAADKDRVKIITPCGLQARACFRCVQFAWLGHSSVLVVMGNRRVLIDPVFSDRASFLSFLGPKRFQPAPVRAQDLPHLDAVLISHDHYDHLDKRTILDSRSKPRVFMSRSALVRFSNVGASRNRKFRNMPGGTSMWSTASPSLLFQRGIFQEGDFSTGTRRSGAPGS